MRIENRHFLHLRAAITASCLALAVLVTGPYAVSAPALHGPAIERVDRTLLEEEPERHAPEMMSRHLTMYTAGAEVDAGELYTVRWIPPPEGTPPGTEVLFEYRQSRDNRPHTLRIRYPFKVTAARNARFKIQGRVYREGGSITAWNVKLMQGTRLLASRASPHWRTQP